MFYIRISVEESKYYSYNVFLSFYSLVTVKCKLLSNEYSRYTGNDKLQQ